MSRTNPPYSEYNEYGEVEEFVELLVKKADASFIWARLVVDEITNSIINGYSRQEDVLEIISSVPEDLTALYKRCLTRSLCTSANNQRKRHASETILLLKFMLYEGFHCWPPHLFLYTNLLLKPSKSLLTYFDRQIKIAFPDPKAVDSQATIPSTQYTSPMNPWLDEIGKRLSNRSGGLLEISIVNHAGLNGYQNRRDRDDMCLDPCSNPIQVQFIHRSVKEALEHQNWQDWLTEKIPNEVVRISEPAPLLLTRAFIRSQLGGLLDLRDAAWPKYFRDAEIAMQRSNIEEYAPLLEKMTANPCTFFQGQLSPNFYSSVWGDRCFRELTDQEDAARREFVPKQMKGGAYDDLAKIGTVETYFLVHALCNQQYLYCMERLTFLELDRFYLELLLNVAVEEWVGGSYCFEHLTWTDLEFVRYRKALWKIISLVLGRGATADVSQRSSLRGTPNPFHCIMSYIRHTLHCPSKDLIGASVLRLNGEYYSETLELLQLLLRHSTNADPITSHEFHVFVSNGHWTFNSTPLALLAQMVEDDITSESTKFCDAGIDMLVEHGADLNATDLEGRSVLNWFCLPGNPPIRTDRSQHPIYQEAASGMGPE